MKKETEKEINNISRKTNSGYKWINFIILLLLQYCNIIIISFFWPEVLLWFFLSSENAQGYLYQTGNKTIIIFMQCAFAMWNSLIQSCLLFSLFFSHFSFFFFLLSPNPMWNTHKNGNWNWWVYRTFSLQSNPAVEWQSRSAELCSLMRDRKKTGGDHTPSCGLRKASAGDWRSKDLSAAREKLDFEPVDSFEINVSHAFQRDRVEINTNVQELCWFTALRYIKYWWYHLSAPQK